MPSSHSFFRRWKMVPCQAEHLLRCDGSTPSRDIMRIQLILDKLELLRSQAVEGTSAIDRFEASYALGRMEVAQEMITWLEERVKDGQARILDEGSHLQS